MKTEQHATLLSEQHSYTSKISLVILLTVCHTILFILSLRIQYQGGKWWE